MFEASKLVSLGREISVLYVEDDVELSKSTEEFLKNFFIVVDTAFNAQKGLALYKEHKHDLVITDIKMPHIDGLEFIRQIKDINPDQKIIVISAFDFSDLVEPGVHKRFDIFLKKPVAYSVMIENLEKICEEILKLKNFPETQGGMSALLRIISLEERVEILETKVKKLEDMLEKK